MTEKIKAALTSLSPAAWKIRDEATESAELFFIRQILDMKRMTDVREYTVTVYVDKTDGEGKKMRGSSSVTLNPGTSDGEIREVLASAISAAGYALNPYFDLADPTTSPVLPDSSDLGALSVEEIAKKMANALFSVDTAADAFVNSAEVFAIRKTVRILTSAGTDVGYVSSTVDGEFISQCKTDSADVETYDSFSYRSLDTAGLARAVANALERVRDRALARTGLPGGTYDVVLSDGLMRSLFSFYTDRANVAMIYPGYSEYKIGEPVDRTGKGEQIDLTLVPTEPFSGDGIPMIRRKMIDGGKLTSYHGPLPFCRYLGVEPTGDYTAIELDNGSLPMAELTAGKCLHVVAFSDFLTDEMTGHFGGEIRLAYLYENGKVTKITGGSVNGSLLDASGELVFSKERYSDATYSGPRAVRIPGVSVAGA